MDQIKTLAKPEGINENMQYETFNEFCEAIIQDVPEPETEDAQYSVAMYAQCEIIEENQGSSKDLLGRKKAESMQLVCTAEGNGNVHDQFGY